MKTLHHGIIVLKYDFYESLICSIDNRSVHPGCSVKRLIRKIKLISSRHIILVSKPDWCVRIDKWDPVKCCSKRPINYFWWHSLYHIGLSHINLTIVKGTLRIRASSTGRYILPKQYRMESLNISILTIKLLLQEFHWNINQKEKKGSATKNAAPSFICVDLKHELHLTAPSAEAATQRRFCYFWAWIKPTAPSFILGLITACDVSWLMRNQAIQDIILLNERGVMKTNLMLNAWFIDHDLS